MTYRASSANGAAWVVFRRDSLTPPSDFDSKT